MTLRPARRYTLDDMALLKIENLGRRVDGRWILWDVNLEVGESEIIGVLGRSESGKSALARIIAGLDQPTSGMTTLSDTGVVPSLATVNPALAPELTAFENLTMFAALWDVPSGKRVNEVARLLEMLRLDDCRGKPCAQLSSGAATRVGIARALIGGSPLILLDGVLDNLDSDVLERLWEHLLKLRRETRGSVVVLTSSGKVAEVCGRIAVISSGKIGFLGRPDDFRRLAGDDMVVLGELNSPLVRTKVQKRFSVMISEEDGFLSFRVAKGEKVVSDLMAEFGSELGCVYLKRPRLEDALDILDGGGGIVADASPTATQ